MPSRKRLKGKQRKATAAARRTVDESEKVDWSQLGRLGECNHGCPVIAPHHPVSALVDDILEAASDESKFVNESMEVSLEQNLHLWNDNKTRKLAN